MYDSNLVHSGKTEIKTTLLQGYIDRMQKSNMLFADLLSRLANIGNELNADQPQENKATSIPQARVANEGRLYSLELLVNEYETGVEFLQTQINKLNSLL